MPIGVRIEESWWYQAVSMVGGTIRRKLIHRASFRASVLQLTLATTQCKNTARKFCALITPFVLIDGHPQVQNRLKAWPTRPMNCTHQTIETCMFAFRISDNGTLHPSALVRLEPARRIPSHSSIPFCLLVQAHSAAGCFEPAPNTVIQVLWICCSQAQLKLLSSGFRIRKVILDYSEDVMSLALP